MAFARDAMRAARIVEARATLETKIDLPFHHHEPPQDAMTDRIVSDRHEIGDLGDAVVEQESRQEHIGVRHVELVDDEALVVGSKRKRAALLTIQKRREDSRRVELRITEEIDLTRHAHERGRSHVSDEAVIFNRALSVDCGDLR